MQSTEFSRQSYSQLIATCHADFSRAPVPRLMQPAQVRTTGPRACHLCSASRTVCRTLTRKASPRIQSQRPHQTHAESSNVPATTHGAQAATAHSK
jgi:hypothetical protein